MQSNEHWENKFVADLQAPEWLKVCSSSRKRAAVKDLPGLPHLTTIHPARKMCIDYISSGIWLGSGVLK